MQYENKYSLFSWCLRVFVVKFQSVIGLWKGCAASVPYFTVHYAVQMYRKVPQSTAKRVKKFGPESIVDYRKVMANTMIREVDEAPKKPFSQNAPQNPLTA
jgi:hypothetical protein